ncbi:MAG TPA: hypothetical protein VFE24_05650 [Pirellulales bacterium]|jgi:ElaB/YqjD/DUF883 family membrane-anchored ribosome-binding protein|nr:hypothetical protein [Pirellulales bacterium]
MSTTIQHAGQQAAGAARQAGDQVRQAGEQAKDQAKSTFETVKETGKQVGNDVLSAVQQFGSDAKRMVQDKTGALTETASDYLDQGRRQAMSLERSLEDQVRAQPLAALLVAAGLGIAIGALINRR